LPTTVTKLAINQLCSQKLFKMCTVTTLTHAAETMPLRLLHNDVPIMHMTTTLNIAKSRTKLQILLAKSN